MKSITTDKNAGMRFAFGDIETGGLNERLDNGQLGMEYYPIFEIAFIITDRDLNQIGEPIRIVIHQTEEEIAKSHPWALEQHTKSGLLDEVRKSTITLSEAQDMIIAHMKALGVDKYDHKQRTGAIFAGNSLMLDRDYFMAQMPTLHGYMHYRQLDVSAFAISCRAWAPELEDLAMSVKKGTHLALVDIQECIDEMRIYRDHLFGGRLPVVNLCQ